MKFVKVGGYKCINLNKTNIVISIWLKVLLCLKKVNLKLFWLWLEGDISAKSVLFGTRNTSLNPL